METNGKGTERRGRLDLDAEELLGNLIALQLRIEGELETIFALLDSDSQRYLRPRFEIAFDSAERTRTMLIEEQKTLREAARRKE
jgi:hypothetical protein